MAGLRGGKAGSDQRGAEEAGEIAAPERIEHVLVVDDLEEDGWLALKKLSEQGIKGTHAKTFEEALDIIFRERPQALLVDLHMPRLAGTKMIEEFRERGYKGKIFGFSARTAEEAGHLLKSFNGIDGYIEKHLTTEKIKKHLVH